MPNYPPLIVASRKAFLTGILLYGNCKQSFAPSLPLQQLLVGDAFVRHYDKLKKNNNTLFLSFAKFEATTKKL
jgi:hypothetical protein